MSAPGFSAWSGVLNSAREVTMAQRRKGSGSPTAKPAIGKRSPAAVNAPEVCFPDRAALRAWLEANHAASGAIWLVYDKKKPKRDCDAGGDRTLTYDAIVEEALCFGWIDSVVARVDGAIGERRAKLYFSPRKPRSVWSAVNNRRVEGPGGLIARSLMTPGGLSKIEAAKADGSWSVLDAAESLIVPEDLAGALARRPIAKRNFEAMPPGARKQFLTWITTAKRPETRAARVAASVELALKNLRFDSPGASGNPNGRRR
jgi:uncharacterized protein YdeI (YjbR/CyaY-like superfamily)